jgi:hypothetical protein
MTQGVVVWAFDVLPLGPWALPRQRFPPFKEDIYFYHPILFLARRTSLSKYSCLLLNRHPLKTPYHILFL